LEDGAISREAPRNPVQETALRAVSCTPGTPRSHARPRLVDRARSCHGTRSRSREQPKATPDHQVSRFAPGRIYVVRPPCVVPDPLRLVASGARLDAGRWTGQVHRPHRRVTTLIGMPCSTVPDPKPRPTRTDPGPEGHVRREPREAWGGEGGGRSASLEPSAGACALSEPVRSVATPRVFHSRSRSPGVNVSHNLERRVGKGMRNISVPPAMAEERSGGAPRQAPAKGYAGRWARGSWAVSVAHEGAASLTHVLLLASRSVSVDRPIHPALFS